MDWTQAITIIGVLDAFIFWLFAKLDSNIKNSNDRMEQLYQMFVVLLKEKK